MHNDDHFHITIVDQCLFGGRGLQQRLEQYHSSRGRVGSAMTSGSLSEAHSQLRSNLRVLPDRAHIQRCLVIRLPPMPEQALRLLIKMSEYERMLMAYTRLVVLSPFACALVRDVLLLAGIHRHVLILPSRQKADTLCEAILFAFPHHLRQPALHKILTPDECSSLIYLSLGTPAQCQAQRLNVSLKTVYTWRRKAVYKMGERNFPGLIRRFISAAPAATQPSTLLNRESKT